MKLKNLVNGGLLAIALAVLSSSAARATLSAQYADGDFVLGFYSPNSSNEFVIDLTKLGFNKYATATYLNTSTHIGDDLSLSNAFGVNWFSNAVSNSIYYGVIQTNNASGNLAVTNPDLAAGPWASGPGQGGPSNDIATVGAQMSRKVQATGQQSIGLLEGKGSGSADWTTYVSYNASTTTNALDQAYTNPDFAGDGAISDFASNNLELDQVSNQLNGSTVVLGTFSLASNGDLTYTTAVPEPSTFAAIGVGAAVLAIARRRKA